MKGMRALEERGEMGGRWWVEGDETRTAVGPEEGLKARPDQPHSTRGEAGGRCIACDGASTSDVDPYEWSKCDRQGLHRWAGALVRWVRWWVAPRQCERPGRRGRSGRRRLRRGHRWSPANPPLAQKE